MKPLLTPLLFFIHSSLKPIRIRSAISFFVETQIDRVLQVRVLRLLQFVVLVFNFVLTVVALFGLSTTNRLFEGFMQSECVEE
ncbi:hypothetical protein P8452_22247 [Trifolium repens]|nr:hypothetical protein P8452_22247 [Trifolium repens]